MGPESRRREREGPSLSKLLGGGKAGFARLAAAYAYSLVPIALAYQVTHYYALLLFNGQIVVVQISDPLGWGWNRFGTADYQLNNAVLGAAFVWYSQVTLIVVGHVIAVYLAHALALRFGRDPRRALRSQYPMLALMVLYTVSSLWIISQPIVEEGRAATLAYQADRPIIAGAPQQSAPHLHPEFTDSSHRRLTVAA